MSRIGKLPIALPSGIQVSVADNVVTVKGPKGTLTQAISEGVTVEVDGGQVVVKRASDEKQHKALH